MTEIDFFDILQGQIVGFLLVLARTSGIFLISPFFGVTNVSRQLRGGIAVAIAMIITPVILNNSIIEAPDNIFLYAGTVLEELFIGFTIGFIAYVAFSAINMAGKIIDMQIGFSVANVMDPTSGQQAPLMGTFLYQLTMLCFLAANGHHIILGALVESFNRIPLDGMVWNNSLPTLMIDFTNGVFLTGMKIAMPVTFTILIVNVGMGILARTMPQMNIFVVGIPLQLTIGMFMISMVLPFYILFLDVMFNDMYGNIAAALKSITPP